MTLVWRGLLAWALTGTVGMAQAPVDEEAPWPRVRQTNGHSVTLHLPQVESWTSNSFNARAAVAVRMAKTRSDLLGVVWLSAHGSVDHERRVVSLDRFEITRGRFPDAPDNGSNALEVVRAVVPSGARTVSLDYLTTALGFAQAAARQGPRGLKHDPPEILWVTNRTVLILIHGEPVLKPVPGGSLERVVNTPALMVRHSTEGRYYLNGDGRWYAAGSIEGPWSLVQNVPADVSALNAISAGGKAAENEEKENHESDQRASRIMVRTRPAELLRTSGLPDFRPIRGTGLQFAADTDSQLFFHTASREAYLLLSGRWFKAKSLSGPWSHVPPRDLPGDFAKIPPGTAQAVVLASVPDTSPAQLAVLANAVPTTATVSRHDARIELAYDGDPQFKTIEGTSLSYAVNSQLPVILAGTNYFALDNGVWFIAPAALGPWQVATEVPEEIYTIPASSPVFYTTFARIYQASEEEVEVGYTAGYAGTYEDDGTVVYGTGWDYEPYYGEDYYDWGWTWGYSYWYVPWYQWWVWRDWWDPPGGLRSALIENIYDRWRGRNGVTHHDSTLVSPGVWRPSNTGYPAQYGRFRGTREPVALTPPANTVALNPYARPSTAVRQGEIPRGAQVLSAVRRTPGGGRDLYASPDGSIYRRKNDGWYRREAGGQWRLAAPAQGVMQRNPAGAANAGAANVFQPRAGLGAPSRIARMPDSGFQARAEDVADLERQYYARSLAQYRAQNWRGTGRTVAPARGGFRRR